MILDSSKFAAVVESAKVRAAGDASWVRAIDRAAEAIAAGEMLVTTLTHGAVITTDRGTYRANGACQCEAFKYGHTACKHRAAARIIEIYESLAVNALAGVGVEKASAERLEDRKTDRARSCG
jgi:hypothetical protein